MTKPRKRRAGKPSKKGVVGKKAASSRRPTKKASGVRTKARKPSKKPTVVSRAKSAKARGAKNGAAKTIRQGATHVEVFNSGLEVWLYDDANGETIRTKNLWRGLIDGGKTDGQIVGYSLLQDDGVSVDVLVGSPLSEAELAVARWLEPQRAFLRLPSGRLAIESNDACRVGEEEPTDKGAIVTVPAGNYSVTLYRIDREALDREEMTWSGAQEVVVLTPGGTKKDDVAGLLPFAERRDLAWVGKIDVSSHQAQGLVWFDDYWDTYFANIDSSAAARMGLTPGKYLRTTVPAAGITLVTVFAPSWEEGAKLRPPAGEVLSEFGFGAVTKPQRWEGQEALFCRRVKAAKAIAARHKTAWLAATFEVLDWEPEGPPKRMRGRALLDTATRAFWHATLADCTYFDDDQLTLSMKLDGRVEGVTFDEPVELREAVERIDAALAKLQLKPQGDFSFDLPGRIDPVEFTVRLYGGHREFFAGVWASTESFEVFLFSRVGGKKWVLTGSIDADDAERITQARPRLSMIGVDEAPLVELLRVHREHLARVGGEADVIPDTLEALGRLYDDYLAAAVD